METDHKPLVSLLQAKNLDELSPRLQHMRMRLMHYDFEVFHSPGKEIVTADFLNRAPTQVNFIQKSDLTKEIETHVGAVLQYYGISNSSVIKLVQAQQNDEECRKLKTYVKEGWKDKKKREPSIKPYF